MQCLIWNVSLLVKTYLVGKSVAVLLHDQKLIWKVPILLYTEQIGSKVLSVAVVCADSRPNFHKILEKLKYCNQNFSFSKVWMFFRSQCNPKVSWKIVCLLFFLDDVCNVRSLGFFSSKGLFWNVFSKCISWSSQF